MELLLKGRMSAYRVVALGCFVLTFLIAANGVRPLFAQETTGDVVSSRRAQLEAQLKQIDQEINAQKAILSEKQKESVSLERDIAILNAQISKAQLSIKARTLTIEKLSEDIRGKGQTITKLSDKMERERASLAQLIRKTDQLDTYSLVEVMLGGESISEFFSDIDSFQSINESVADSITVVKDVKRDTEVERSELEGKKQEESTLREAQVLERKRIEQAEAEKKRILKLSKGKEQEYQKIIKDKEKSAAAIRAELFSLRGSAAIPFGKALEYANLVSEKTGVRPAFLLGIIAEESNLGENVGTGNWRVDMHPTRDQPIFQQLIASLGLDPDAMPVSKKPWYGYGGAMGPAQFIPSTWVCYAGYINTSSGRCGKNADGSWSGPWVYDKAKDRIGALTGNTPPNPWEPQDAFMASGLLLSDNGAWKKTPEAERFAALCYLAGCANAKKPAYAFYGDDVIALAAKYQGMIDTLQGN